MKTKKCFSEFQQFQMLCNLNNPAYIFNHNLRQKKFKFENLDTITFM